MLLRGENFVHDHTPSRSALSSIFLKLWTGSDPHGKEEASWVDVLSDPAAFLPPHGIKAFEPHAHHHSDAVLFQQEDIWSWSIFTAVFFLLVGFDNLILHRRCEKLTLLQSTLYTTFWIAVAGMFNVYVYVTRGADDAFSWGTGYLLEWMLSVDNLFVFHRIFIVMKTPDEQKHKPLFYGIIGAIVFRMIFFVISETLLHHVTWMHLVFGSFLVYTGWQALPGDDEDDDNPEQNALYQLIIQHINYVDRYDDQGRFFTPVEVTRDLEKKEGGDGEKQTEVVVEWKATKLVLVVVCLEVTDLVFAVDSVSAIVAQIPDLFLAYTAAVFAMLGLRALFFAIDELVKMFALLAYGVAVILIFIGLKLILRSWIHFPPALVCAILVGTLFFSVFASLIQEKFFPSEDDNPEDTGTPGAPPEPVSARLGKRRYTPRSYGTPRSQCSAASSR